MKIKLFVCFLMISLTVCTRWCDRYQVDSGHGEISYLSLGRSEVTDGFVSIGCTDDAYQKIENPSYTDDQNFLTGKIFMEKNPNYAMFSPMIIDLKTGHDKVCETATTYAQVIPFELSRTQEMLIVNEARTINYYDMDTCQEGELILEVDFGSTIEGIALYNELLLYGVHNTSASDENSLELHLLDLLTKQDKVIASGLNPAWSPDGESVAFLNYQGFSILDLTSKDELQVQVGKQLSLEGTSLRWSSDNRFILVTVQPEDEDPATNYQIYLYDLEHDSMELLVQNGYDPFWIIE